MIGYENSTIIGDLFWRPIGDLLETHRRPTCLIGDPSKNDMPHRRPTCLIGDLPRVGLQWGMLVYDEVCRSPMGLQSGMWLSDQACHSPIGLRGETCQSLIRLVGLRWVFNRTCWYPMGLRSGMLVSDEACRFPIGLQWGMSVSDWSPIRHVSLQWVSDRSPISLR